MELLVSWLDLIAITGLGNISGGGSDHFIGVYYDKNRSAYRENTSGEND